MLPPDKSRRLESIARLDALRSFNFWQRMLKDIAKRGKRPITLARV